MRVLAGDIGGTKTLLQVADVFPSHYKVILEKSFDSRAYDEFLSMVKEFVKEAAGRADMILNSACFGVAGPVQGRVVKTTNLPWVLDADGLSNELGIPAIFLINDFQAIGYGIDALEEKDLFVLQPGEEEENGPRAIIGAGTGLGEGIMVWQQDHYQMLPSEGGHVDFAPTNAEQMDFLRYMMDRFGRVDYESVVSGGGLVNIYNFFSQRDPAQSSPELDKAMREGDAAAAISRFALEKKSKLAVDALEMFCEIYGAQAGNLALTCLARGGVYVAGGIAPKIIEKLKEGAFLRAFHSKCKMEALMKKFPVKVILNSKVGLLGAASFAARPKT
jgi:glucokinase